VKNVKKKKVKNSPGMWNETSPQRSYFQGFLNSMDVVCQKYNQLIGLLIISRKTGQKTTNIPLEVEFLYTFHADV
jgi:hypothetical protein